MVQLTYISLNSFSKFKNQKISHSSLDFCLFVSHLKLEDLVTLAHVHSLLAATCWNWEAAVLFSWNVSAMVLTIWPYWITVIALHTFFFLYLSGPQRHLISETPFSMKHTKSYLWWSIEEWLTRGHRYGVTHITV